ncbi:MAG: FtsX-like permease family protein [Bacteroidota bacterium]
MMIWNYLKLSLKVLQRRQFFTFVSLFGISSTLMILTVVITFLQNEIGGNAPLEHWDRLVLCPYIDTKMIETDTTYTIDTSYREGQVFLDSTASYSEEQAGHMVQNLSIKTIREEISKSKRAVNWSLFQPFIQFTTFQKGKKLRYRGLYTDASYFELFNFQFLEGRPYHRTEVERNLPVAVISRKTSREYFGQEAAVVGKTIEFNRRQYEVVGVIEDVVNSHYYVQSEVLIPYTLSNVENFAAQDHHGRFEMVLLAADATEREALKAELISLGSKLPIHAPQNYNRVGLLPFTPMEDYAREYFDASAQRSQTYFYWTVCILVVLLLLLPTLNLININITRIIERSSEIGVRKSFGAHSGNLVGQFLMENLVLTAIGATIGFALYFGLLQWINGQSLLGPVKLQFNPILFGYCLALILCFGILSGIYPAWRMSKLNIVDALKNKRND